MNNQDRANLWRYNPMTGARVKSAREVLQEMSSNTKPVKRQPMDREKQDLLGALYSREPNYQAIHSCNIWRTA